MKTKPYKTKTYNTPVTLWTHPDAGQTFVTIGKNDKESGEIALSHMTGGKMASQLFGIEAYSSNKELKNLPEYEG